MVIMMTDAITTSIINTMTRMEMTDKEDTATIHGNMDMMVSIMITTNTVAGTRCTTVTITTNTMDQMETTTKMMDRMMDIKKDSMAGITAATWDTVTTMAVVTKSTMTRTAMTRAMKVTPISRSTTGARTVTNNSSTMGATTATSSSTTKIAHAKICNGLVPRSEGLRERWMFKMAAGKSRRWC
ncbi:uncharacterized protein Z520_03786 [Fonsecaea multimorphosa CBS 102226]|uniref:Uncharacterized protein n=1 Tax=Fonsecaea multimorphosa CBS 102226 TaxID=1442371 RepID=A0A0D2HDX4_9EURO|nr:uncharacterized protein Z520_03786 [Fonsecaea multimorphosa CBS 102226]KIY00101.1 hypothetical protein Z520_03786 [Fonsecaea multimorphosa CBS 102226]OAL27298.1 hypothetical protein AYO22_03573 [Fonsecaea multimorphosa]